MKTIEELEKSLRDWKAARLNSLTDGVTPTFDECADRIRILIAALADARKPSNTQMQIDSATQQSAKYMCMRCGLLLTSDSGAHCPHCD